MQDDLVIAQIKPLKLARGDDILRLNSDYRLGIEENMISEIYINSLLLVSEATIFSEKKIILLDITQKIYEYYKNDYIDFNDRYSLHKLQKLIFIHHYKNGDFNIFVENNGHGNLKKLVSTLDNICSPSHLCLRSGFGYKAESILVNKNNIYRSEVLMVGTTESINLKLYFSVLDAVQQKGRGDTCDLQRINSVIDDIYVYDDMGKNDIYAVLKIFSINNEYVYVNITKDINHFLNTYKYSEKDANKLAHNLIGKKISVAFNEYHGWFLWDSLFEKTIVSTIIRPG